MRNIRNWYQLLEQSGLSAVDTGPGAANGTLTANVLRHPYIFTYPSGLTLSGTLSPDATGLYTPSGIYNQQIYLYNAAGYYLWYDMIDDLWTISTALGSFTPGYWTGGSSPIISGQYSPSGYTGIGTLEGQSLRSYKGLEIDSSISRITSSAAAGMNVATGSVELLFIPAWSNADGQAHYFWDTYGGSNQRFLLAKLTDGTTILYTGNVSRGSFTYAWTAGYLYHIVLNWPANTLYINGLLAKTFSTGTLGTPASTLYIGDRYTTAANSLYGTLYCFLVRDLPLTLLEILYFKNFFTKLYYPQVP